MIIRITSMILLLLLTACTLRGPSQQAPYIKAELPTVIEHQGKLKQRVILLGDAGLSTIKPLQKSLQKAIVRAKQSPSQTSVLMLGDNIYPDGFPNKKTDQQSFDKEQQKHISYLEAQLQVANQSGAEMFILPGNHDWYASQVDSQADYIENYATKHQLEASFVPYQKNSMPLPQLITREGISIIFLDTMWLLKAKQTSFDKAINQLELLLKQSAVQFPENIILVAAHHPLKTVGPHGGYFAQFGLESYVALVTLFNNNQQDIHRPLYQRSINAITKTLSPYKRVIFAGGHDHSLQLLKSDRGAPQYHIVSGAANTKKLTGVGSSEETQFALSQEGLVEIDVLENGVLLRAYDINHTEPVHQQWLWTK